MKNILEKQIIDLNKKEEKLLNQTENTLLQATLTPVMDKIQEVIPEKLKSTLNIAFYKGFQFIFEHGSPYIEKTYNKEKLQMEYDINNYAVDKGATKRHMNRLDKPSVQSKMVHSTFSAVEGGVLGFLGVGIPDIPIFLSVVVRSIYEVALSYGFGYSTEQEKAYILLIICAAMSNGDQKHDFDKKVEQLGTSIDQNTPYEINLEDQMRIASDTFANALLTAKFIQGIPFVGAVGGVINYSIMKKITSYARLKYKKRYLKKKSSNPSSNH